MDSNQGSPFFEKLKRKYLPETIPETPDSQKYETQSVKSETSSLISSLLTMRERTMQLQKRANRQSMVLKEAFNDEGFRPKPRKLRPREDLYDTADLSGTREDESLLEIRKKWRRNREGNEIGTFGMKRVEIHGNVGNDQSTVNDDESLMMIKNQWKKNREERIDPIDDNSSISSALTMQLLEKARKKLGKPTIKPKIVFAKDETMDDKSLRSMDSSDEPNVTISSNLSNPLQELYKQVQHNLNHPAFKDRKTKQEPVIADYLSVSSKFSSIHEDLNLSESEFPSPPIHKRVNSPPVHKQTDPSPIRKQIDAPIRKQIDAPIGKQIDSPIHKHITIQTTPQKEAKVSQATQTPTISHKNPPQAQKKSQGRIVQEIINLPQYPTPSNMQHRRSIGIGDNDHIVTGDSRENLLLNTKRTINPQSNHNPIMQSNHIPTIQSTNHNPIMQSTHIRTEPWKTLNATSWNPRSSVPSSRRPKLPKSYHRAVDLSIPQTAPHVMNPVSNQADVRGNSISSIPREHENTQHGPREVSKENNLSRKESLTNNTSSKVREDQQKSPDQKKTEEMNNISVKINGKTVVLHPTHSKSVEIVLEQPNIDAKQLQSENEILRDIVSQVINDQFPTQTAAEKANYVQPLKDLLQTYFPNEKLSEPTPQKSWNHDDSLLSVPEELG